jgi:hypothetical protein
MTIREFRKKLIGDGVSPKMARHIAGAAKEIQRLYNAGFALHEAGKTAEAKKAESQIVYGLKALSSVTIKMSEMILDWEPDEREGQR